MSTSTGPARTARSRLGGILAVWTIVLLVGYVVVVTLGSPLPTSTDQLAAAKAPPTPVTDDIARQSAETIVRLEYPDFLGAEPVIERRTDFGIDRFLIVYSDPEQGAGLRISITIESGLVEVASFN